MLLLLILGVGNTDFGFDIRGLIGVPFLHINPCISFWGCQLEVLKEMWPVGPRYSCS